MENSSYPPGRYLETSRNVRVESVDEYTFQLIAECKKADGSWVESSIKYNIDNWDGQLTFEEYKD